MNIIEIKKYYKSLIENAIKYNNYQLTNVVLNTGKGKDNYDFSSPIALQLAKLNVLKQEFPSFKAVLEIADNIILYMSKQDKPYDTWFLNVNGYINIYLYELFYIKDKIKDV